MNLVVSSKVNTKFTNKNTMVMQRDYGDRYGDGVVIMMVLNIYATDILVCN
jgi:hypothetical protein